LSGVAGSIVTGTGELQVGARGAVGVTFAGDLTGTFTLAKVGAGTLVLTGNNSAHDGVWDVRLGRLQIGDGVTAGVTTGTGSLSIADGATVAINLPGNETLSRTLSGSGVLEKLGTGTLTANQPNDTFSGTVRVSAGTLALGGAGNFGTATIEANATVLLGGSGDYVFANNITGTGSLVKDGGTTTATWLGSGNVNVEVRAGTLAIGNGTDALQQTQLATTTLADGATLRIAPVGDGTVTLGDIVATGTGRVEKEGDGTAVLIGAVKAQGGIAVNEGELSLGNGTGRSVLQVTGPIYVASAAALSVSRIGETRITGAVTGEGDLLLSGDNNGAGSTVLLSTDNQLSGTVHLSRHAVLQVGDTGAASRLTDSSPLDVQIESGATLRFTQTTAPETGSTESIGGAGTVEYAGTGSLAFSDGTASTFAGTFLASAGTFVFDAATLPAATLNATGAGILRIESDAPVTTLAPTFGAGDGTIALGAAPDAGGFVRYGFSNAPVFGGTLAVSAQTELRLSGETLTAQTVQVQRDAYLTGTGTISGVLHNAQGGTLSPGSGSAGQIFVQGDFTNEGALVIAVDSLNSTSAVHYTGTARVNPATSTVQLQMTPALYELFLLGAEIKILVDDQPTGGKADVLGSFRPQNISVDDGTGEIKVGYAIAYDAGSGGMSIIHLNNLGDLPKLHDGLRGFANALSELVLNGGSSSELIALMSAPNPRIAIENASPLALSSLTAMPINSAQEDFTNLHAHLESLRFSRGATGGQVGSQPYITVTGNYVRNGTGASDPVYNFNTYGAMVGFDQAAGEQFIVGLNAAYHHGKADFSHGGGTAKHDNGRLNFYGTWVASDYVYVDATVFAGYSTNDVKQITALGTTKSKPKGYDFGGSVYTGGIVPLSDTLHLTPYVGFEYVYANVDGVRQTVVDVSKFDQDSLRVKIGTGLSWLVPTQADFSVRVSFDVSFAHELLDTDAALNARFAGDPTGRKFRVDAAALPENSLQVGPAVEFGFDNNKSVQFGYRLEHDLKNQTTHHLNASFRMRF
ncbi:MAG: autotransporter domain-containing protein, partial [Puniceicoccales bacterium]|nr:autotransporter domain-containing protein [Puniceicoccales bacterium]